MRLVLTWMLILGTTAASAFAGTPDNKDTKKDATKDAIAVTVSAETRPPAKPVEPVSAAAATNDPSSSSASMERELLQLKDLLLEQSRELEAQRSILREQNAKIDALEKRYEIATTDSSVVSAPRGEAAAIAGAAPQEDSSQKIGKLETEVGNSSKTVEAIKKSNPFTFGGDVRFRVEPFWGGPVATVAGQSVNPLEQVRTRVRVRFNVDAKINDQLSGGFSVASGDINDPISTNQTLSAYYTRKFFLLDRFFIKYNPNFFKPFTLTVGKFAYPWYRTELTWDNDLNPEGAAQTLAFNLHTPILKKITVVGFELPFNNVAGNATNGGSGANVRRVNSSFVYGGQVGTNWEFTPAWKASAYIAFYDYHRADSIALALNAANTPQQLGNIFRLGGSSVQNVFATVPTGTVTTTLPGGVPTFSTTFTPGGPVQFASKFGLVDVILRNDFKTGWDRFPAVLLFDYVQNTRACGNVSSLPANAVLTNGLAGYSVSVPSGGLFTPPASVTCNSAQKHGYWAEARVGRLQERGDWTLAYTFLRIEREAVMGAFNFSDIRQSSNVANHRVEVFYQAHKNVHLDFAGLFGRPLGTTERFLKRIQMDIVYKF